MGRKPGGTPRGVKERNGPPIPEAELRPLIEQHEQAMRDLAEGRALFLAPPDPDDPYASYQYEAALRSLGITQKEIETMSETTQTANPTTVAIAQLRNDLEQEQRYAHELENRILALEGQVTEMRDMLASPQQEKVVYVTRDPLLDQALDVYARVAPMKLPYQVVADELGVDPERLRRVVDKLQKEGSLRVHETIHPGSTKTFRKWSFVPEHQRS